MKKIIPILSLFLLSCATSQIDSFPLVKNSQPYNRVLVIYYSNEREIAGLTQENFEADIAPTMNLLKEHRYRKQLDKTLERNLGSKGTIIIKSTEVFPTGDKVDFNGFQAVIKSTGAQAVLLINNYTFWNSVRVEDGTSSTSPNAGFNNYLYDVKSDSFAWKSNVIVWGSGLAGFDTLNNTLARRISRKLQKEKYIYPTEKYSD